MVAAPLAVLVSESVPVVVVPGVTPFTVQVTPILAGSLATVAVNGKVVAELRFRLDGLGVTATVTGSEMVTGTERDLAG